MKNKPTKSIYGIGVDICNSRRVYEKLSTQGEKFAEKILTSGEYTLYSKLESKEQKAQFVAKCWAVKEAFVKALGTGFTGNFMWGDISYFSPSSNYTMVSRPMVVLSDRAMMDGMMRNRVVHLSVSDEVENAIAFVTIEEVN